MSKEILFKGVESVSEYRAAVESSFADFKEKNNIQKVIAISGGSDAEQTEDVSRFFKEFILNLEGCKFAILTGGTKGGIPEIALKSAKEAGIPTIGVVPGRGRKYLYLEMLDLAIETYPPTYGNADWGTETSTFVQFLDGIVVVGGAFGTLVEVASVLKINTSRMSRGNEPIYICPISGTGGVADIIFQLPDVNKVLPSLPFVNIVSGEDAGKFLRNKLFDNIQRTTSAT